MKRYRPGGMRWARGLSVALAMGAVFLLVISGGATGAPSVTTDKDEYLYGETALISGLDFQPGQVLDVTVQQPDGSIVKGDGTQTPGWDVVTADGAGAFTLPWIVNGPHGEYTVRVYDHGDTGHTTVLATTVFDDDTPYPSSVSITVMGLTASVSGTWDWTANCATKTRPKKHVGFAVDWGDGTGVPNVSPPPSAHLDGVYPTHMPAGTWDRCQPPGTGSFGTVSHTYATAGTFNICVITYDVHFVDPGPPPTSGNHSTDPRGSPEGGNSDNSYEQFPYYPSKQWKCQNTPVSGSADVKVTAVTVTAPSSASVGSAFNVTVTATIHDNGPTTPVNTDTTLDLGLPPDCSKSPSGTQLADNVSLATSTSQQVQATWSVTCTAPSAHTFSGSATIAIDQTGLTDSNPANNSGSGSAGTNVTATSDVKVSGVSVSAPGSASVGSPFNVTVTATLHNNGSYGPANVDTTLDLTVPGDCTRSPNAAQSVQDTSLAVSTATPVQATWSVTCTAPSAHSFGGSADAAIDQLHVSDPDSGNNSGSGSAGTNVTATSDVKVSAVTVSAPGSASVGSPFNVTATATLHNNGTYGPANVDTTFTLSAPGDCTTSSANPQTVQDTSLAVSSATTVPASPATWSVTCTSPSAHSFSVTADAAVDQLHVSDPDSGNNSGSGGAGTNVTAESDVKVSGVSVSAPGSASVGSPFNVTATAILHNNGSYGPTNVDTTLTLSLPPDCTTSSANPQTVQDTSLPTSTATSVPASPATWSVTCTSPSAHSFSATADVAIDQLHVSDPDSGNNSGSGSAGTNVTATSDVKVSGVSVSAPGSASVGSPFNVTATATLHNNGTYGPANVDTTFTLSAPGDCTIFSTNPQTVQDTSLPTSTATNVPASPVSWQVSCANPSAHSFSVTADAAVDQLHVSDPTTTNNSGSGSAVSSITALSDIKMTSATAAAPGSSSVNTPFTVIGSVTIHNFGPYGPTNVDTDLTLNLPPDCTTSSPNPQMVQDTSLAVSSPVIVPASPASWTVSCSSPSTHQFTVTGCDQIDQAHVTDPDMCNNSASANVFTTITAPVDVKVSGVTATAPASVGINTPFTVTGSATLHNNGPYSPVNVDTTFTLTMPGDCTTSSSNPVSVQNTSLSTSVPVTVPGSPVSWTVTCTDPSAHAFTVTADVAVDQTHVIDTNTANNSNSGNASTNVTATSDVKVSGVSVSAPGSADVGSPFNVTVTATLHNNGSYGPANVDTTLDLTVPGDCTRSPNAAQSVQDTSLAVSAATPVQATWSVTCTAPSAHSFGGSADAAIDQLHVSDPDSGNNSGSGSAGTNVTATSDVKVSGVSVSAPGSADVGSPFNVTATATLHNNGSYGPTNVDTTLDLTVPGDCTRSPNAAQSVQDTSLAVSTATPVQATWSVTCADPSNHSFGGSATAAIDQLHVSDPNSGNNSGSGSGGTVVGGQADLKVTGVTVTAPAGAGVNTPFNVTVDATVHNNGPVTPATADATLSLSVPGDCTKTPAGSQSETGLSLAQSTSTPVSKTWSVTCTNPSSHSFGGSASVEPGALHLGDPNSGNNSGSGSGGTNVTATSDVKVSGVSVSAPGSASVGTPFNVTATATLHNNGSYGPTNVDVTLSLSLPPDCTTSSANPQTVQDTSLPTSTATNVPASPATWSVTCTSPSAHSFSVTADAAVDQLHVSDPDSGNNSGSGGAGTNVTATSDVKVSGVSVSAPGSAGVGSPFNVTVTATLHNNGSYGPANVDTTLDLTVPGDCTRSPNAAQSVQDTSLAVSAATPVQATWSVTCTAPSNHSFGGSATAAIDQLHVSDPDSGNNSGSGSAGTAVSGSADVKVSGVTVTAPATASVNTPFNVTVNATVHNNGPVTPATADVTVDLTVPGDCTKTPSGSQAQTGLSLAQSASTPVSKTWSVTCSGTGAHTFTGSGSIVLNQLHVSDPNAANNAGQGTGNTDIVPTTVNFTVHKDFSDDNPASVTVSLTCGSGTVSPSSASASESSPAVFTVTGASGNPTCTATESPIPPGYSSTGNCSAALSVGQCTIVNILTTPPPMGSFTFLVFKDFSDDNPASVTVSLTCESGTVSPSSASASESSPAVFTVTDALGDPTCTATENPIPSGYSSTGNCSALGSAGQCTITNTLLPPGGGGTPNPVGGVLGLIDRGGYPSADGAAPGANDSLALLLLVGAFPFVVAAAVWIGRRRRTN